MFLNSISSPLNFVSFISFLRCPQLKSCDPQIYWYGESSLCFLMNNIRKSSKMFQFTDLENDKIKITCDDDLKFFMEESPCQKIVFDFRPESELELTRKRTRSQQNEDASECSKRIRKQLQEFDLSSDSSSMDTDDDFGDNLSSSTSTSKNSSVCDITQTAQDDQVPTSSTSIQEEPKPSTSTADVSKSPNVNIISVETIRPAEVILEIPDDNGNDVQIIDEASTPEVSVVETDAVQQSNVEIATKKKPEPNRIVITDSSDDEEPDDTTNNNNRRHSYGPNYSSTYSFTNVNGNGFESRSSFSGGNHRHSHHRYRRNFHEQQAHQRARFEEQARNFQRCHAENMERVQENVRAAGAHAARAVRASASAIPDLVSTFRTHFQPLFRVADINQQIFGTFGRR